MFLAPYQRTLGEENHAKSSEIASQRQFCKVFLSKAIEGLNVEMGPVTITT
jgi:hypothetical protein